MASSSAERLLLDTSAALALLILDHEAHVAVAARVRGHELGLAGHAAFETFSILTRQPRPWRLSPAAAHRAIRAGFPAGHQLSTDGADRLFAQLPAAGIGGGAVFDALVAAAAHEAETLMISRDRRAATVYRAIGAAVEFV
ncbi:PIN domain-containing protein [Microbacterium elymi]|uniref:Ribonuclease VapC n=1 Tax=Microbacterium elymi TaxID=2909587 RepID=A0ABY5NHA6_9MICO|nr:PIN domain-containing protein [Microbacterium elymi]UUT34476.1 PIN domain-containing protein [Microbacterium elymi]